MNSSIRRLLMPLGMVVAGLAIGNAGIYIGDTDDAPGAALLGIILMLGLVTHGARLAWRNRTSPPSKDAP